MIGFRKISWAAIAWGRRDDVSRNDGEEQKDCTIWGIGSVALRMKNMGWLLSKWNHSAGIIGNLLTNQAKRGKIALVFAQNCLDICYFNS